MQVGAFSVPFTALPSLTNYTTSYAYEAVLLT